MNTQQIHSCAYCGNVAYYQLHSGKWCCQPAYQKCPALIKKNKAGLAIAYQNGLEERNKNHLQLKADLDKDLEIGDKQKKTIVELKHGLRNYIRDMKIKS